ncbi:MAG TPA: tyrosine-type recombinase/integrase [Melioribacteraceae bacterium]|nr:tyrosine-type recombinase/integrase [Melioribacteraceae bacterium]
MAEIYKRNGVIWLTYSVYGKRYRESLGLKDTRENRILAKKIKLQKEADILNGIHPLIKKVKKKTLSEAYKDFEKTKENRSSQLINLYKYCYDKLIDFLGNIEVKKINEDAVKNFYNELQYYKKKNQEKLAKSTIEIIFRHLRIIFEFYVRQRIIEENPFPRLERSEKKIIVISKDELELILYLLKKHNEEQYRVIRLFMMTGFRVSELIRFEHEDIDYRRNIIYVKNNKGKRVDQFPLYKELRDFLLSFSNQSGKVIKYKDRNSLKFFGRFLNREKLEHYTIHELRKTFLSRLANSGMSLFDIQKLARHRDIRTTQKYYLEADYMRLGNRINDVISGTLEGTMPQNALKIAQK